jgi:hypothetical protein
MHEEEGLIMHKQFVILASTSLLLFSAAIHAQNAPQELVRQIYLAVGTPAGQSDYQITTMISPAYRQRYFTPEMVELFEINDTYGDDLIFGCVPMPLILGGNDFMADEIHRTLSLDSQAQGNRRIVDAHFTNFGEPNHYRYAFEEHQGHWKIADIAAMGSWQLSSLECEPAD